MNLTLPKEVQYIIEMLQNSKYDAYIVGGCVRDILLNTTPHDWDICTSALPNEVMHVFKNEKIIETGLKHGTVTVIKNDIPFEITTFRTESGYTDNRRPDTVNFVSNISQDLLRRDFTINAMAYNSDKGLVDLFDGQSDIKNKIIKTVGNSDTRFNEDALRILRALRFASQLKFNINADTSHSIHNNKQLLNNIAAERIWSEFKKILTGKQFVKILRAYVDVISVFIPQIGKMKGFNQQNPYHFYDVWEHTLHALEYSPDDIIIKLAVLFHDIGKPETFSVDDNGVGHFYGHPKVSRQITENIFIKLKVDNNTKNQVLTLVENHDKMINASEKSVKKSIQRLGSRKMFRNLIYVKMCDVRGQSKLISEKRIKHLEQLLKIEERLASDNQLILSVKELNINGNDIIALGISQGEQVGYVLKQLLKLVMDNKIKNTHSHLVNAAKEIILNIDTMTNYVIN